MGKRGPQRTPTEILALRGSWLAKKRSGNQLACDGKTPKCPDWLGGGARKYWYRVIRNLAGLSLLSSTDFGAVARYAVYYDLWVREMKNPERSEKALNNYAKQLLRFEQNFGFNPMARNSMDISSAWQPENDPFERLRK